MDTSARRESVRVCVCVLCMEGGTESLAVLGACVNDAWPQWLVGGGEQAGGTALGLCRGGGGGCVGEWWECEPKNIA